MNRKTFFGVFLGAFAAAIGIKKKEPEIPESFKRGMEDYKAGRTIDMETALNGPCAFTSPAYTVTAGSAGSHTITVAYYDANGNLISGNPDWYKPEEWGNNPYSHVTWIQQ
jgi:hypothetical protein